MNSFKQRVTVVIGLTPTWYIIILVLSNEVVTTHTDWN